MAPENDALRAVLIGDGYAGADGSTVASTGMVSAVDLLRALLGAEAGVEPSSTEASFAGAGAVALSDAASTGVVEFDTCICTVFTDDDGATCGACNEVFSIELSIGTSRPATWVTVPLNSDLTPADPVGVTLLSIGKWLLCRTGRSASVEAARPDMGWSDVCAAG